MRCVSNEELILIEFGEQQSDVVESFLQGQLSQDVAQLKQGETLPSLLLDPSGKLVSTLRVRRLITGDLVLICEVSSGDSVVAALQRFNLGNRIQIGHRTVPVVRVRHLKTESLASLGECEMLIPDFWGPDWVAVDYIAPDFEISTDGNFDNCRIVAGVPAMGAELEVGMIPAEGSIVSGFVSFDKGCYLGQELVARMDSRDAQARRRLVRFVSEQPVQIGCEVSSDGKAVGLVTSVASGLNHQGLGYINRGHPDGVYSVGGASIDVATLEFDGSKLA